MARAYGKRWRGHKAVGESVLMTAWRRFLELCGGIPRPPQEIGVLASFLRPMWERRLDNPVLQRGLQQ